MNLDATIPLWGILALGLPSLISLVWWLISLHFEVKEMKKTLNRALQDIDVLESSMSTEVKAIHVSINQINNSLQELNTLLKLVVDGKILTK